MRHLPILAAACASALAASAALAEPGTPIQGTDVGLDGVPPKRLAGSESGAPVNGKPSAGPAGYNYGFADGHAKPAPATPQPQGYYQNRLAGTASVREAPAAGARGDGQSGSTRGGTITGRVTNAQGQPETAAAAVRPGDCVLRPGGAPCDTRLGDPAAPAGINHEYGYDGGIFVGFNSTESRDPGAAEKPAATMERPRGRTLGQAETPVRPSGCVLRPGGPPCDAKPGDPAPAGLHYAYGTAGGRPNEAAKTRRADSAWTLGAEVNFLSAPPTAGAPLRAAGRLPRGQRVLVNHCEGGWCLLNWDGGHGWVSETQAGLDGFR